MSNTLLAIARVVAKDEGLGYAQFSPTAGGTTTTSISTAAGGPFDADDDSTLFANAWLKCEADSAVSPQNVGEIRRIDKDTGYTPGTGTLTHRAFSNSTTTTMTMGVYMGLPPADHGLNKGISTFVNQRLRNSFYKTLFLLTEATDGDMESSGTTSYSGTNATLTKVTSGAGVIAGDQALQVTTTAANGYCTLATALSCTEGEVWEIAVDCTPTSGIWKLQAWDATASAEIEVTSTYDGVQPRRLWLQVTIPTDCETFNVRLIGETITTVAVFDNLSIRKLQRQYTPLPSWLTDDEWLEEVWFYPPGTQHNNAYAIGERDRYYPVWWGVQESFTDLTPFYLELVEFPPSGSHIFISAIRPYGELSADSSSTDLDLDFISLATLIDVYSDKGDKKNLERCALRFKQLGLQRHVPKVKRRTYRMQRDF